MTAEEIQKAYTALLAKQREIRVNATYAFGKNYGILTDKDKPKPDNRIPIPLGKSAVIDVTGYAGRPGEIKTEYVKTTDDKPEEDEITKLLGEFDEHNNEGLENSELLTTTVSLGEAWELWYTSDRLELKGGMRTPEYKIIDNLSGLAIFSNDIKPVLESFLYFGKDKENLTCDDYQPLKSERWIRGKNDGTWTRNPEGDTIYPYKTVPVIQFRSSMADTPIFEAQKPIIDGLDRIVSNTQNEVDRFAALMMLFPGATDKEFRKQLTDALTPFIDQLDQYDAEKWPQYLSKDYTGIKEFYQFQTEYLEEAFHKTIKIMDITDKNFAGDQSGIAMAYKLIGIEFVISGIEIYFRLGLKQRFEFYKDIFAGQATPVSLDDYEQVITWKRNLPVDDQMKVTIAAMLQGLGFDMSTIIKYLPNSIIENMTEAEIKAMLGEQEPIGDGEPLLIDGITDPVEAVKLSGIQITAANEIITNVANQILTREAGINQLMVFLGLTKEQAEKVMGKQNNSKVVTVKT